MLKRRRLDSDDDDDEFVASPAAPFASSRGPADEVAYGEGSSSSSVMTDDEEERVGHSSSAVPQEPKDQSAPPRKAEPLSFVQPDDSDISYDLFRVLPTAFMLRSYLTPLKYLQSGLECDNVLLAQYACSTSYDSEHEELPKTPAVPPGTRWDGVVRGRRKMESNLAGGGSGVRMNLQ